ncbi:hypothetical protein NGM10_01965 [Halorussus salilacus]|uniref:hypothetical protein n=1 Tax=Halorussus salilacus TaxID=2953750 RepID=UPI00209FA00B|nr:hypothetical protein [Halorussus salilacus]USZ68518.1 hypothetical protein NGM10_01965 [Halorussus salilacus]
MTDERPTIRPVTLPRLVELVYLCDGTCQQTADIEEALDVTHRRARETILEGLRINLIVESDEDTYETSTSGRQLLDAVRSESWSDVSQVLETQSPHYGAFLDVLDEQGSVSLNNLLAHLAESADETPYTYNQASVEVVGDWAERLGAVQRHAFTGDYYRVEHDTVPTNFQQVLLEEYDRLEETTGVNLRQRYLSIPQLREQGCERLRCTRTAFDAGLLSLCRQNVGKLELSGAPLDTTAKDAALGIKQIQLIEGPRLVSTSQSTERVMQGIEQFDKQYYYLAVHDHKLTFTSEEQ